MAFDGIVTKAIVTEFKNMIIGGKIDKIYEPDKNTIVLGIYSQGKHLALNICIDSHNCRINLTTHSKINPLVAPNFCMLLRKYLLGGRISDISMMGLERLVNIKIETINEFNEIEYKTLIIELMGKHSNVILTNKDNMIIDAMRHLDSSNNSYRDILPSRSYILPNSDKYDFTTLKNFDDFYNKISAKTENLSKGIADTFTGFSISFVHSAIENCNINTYTKNDLEKIYIYICNILNDLTNTHFDILYKDTKKYDYVIVQQKEDYMLNFFIDDFYFERETAETFKNYRNNILRLILNILKKYSNRLVNINTKLEECADMEKYRLYGELITANLYKLSNTHSESIELENYYDNNNLINIPLDIKYSPNINAKRYFKKYSKLKNAMSIVSEQKEETESELNYIESIVYELENSTTLEDVQTIFEEISENVIFKESLKQKKKSTKTSKKKKQITFSPLKYEIDGHVIYVGKNNKENDWLTLSFANKSDLWFHTKDIHGSHVILKTDRPVDDNILVKCAQIAAKHSKASQSSNVPVDYCLVQYVKKPNGAKPGMVIFSKNKTLNVNPKDFSI